MRRPTYLPNSGGLLDDVLSDLVVQHTQMAQSIAAQVWRQAPHAMELEELKSLAYLGLVTAADRWHEYCLAPETPVLTADLRWVPVGDLEVGHGLVGVDEYPTEPRVSRSFRRAYVTETSRRLAPTLRLTFEDGRQVVCSTDHRWLTYKSGWQVSRFAWVNAFNIVPGDSIVSPIRVWGQDSSFEAGWLAGILDGEGCLTIAKDRAHSDVAGGRGVAVGQNEGLVLDRIKDTLAAMDIPFTISMKRTSSGAYFGYVSVVTRRYAIELLGRLRPVRLDASILWEGARIRSRGVPAYAQVVEVEHLGPGEVITLGTTTKTFLANGLVSHNCARNGYDSSRVEYFTPYAARRMRGTIFDSLRSADWATRSQRTKAKQLQAAGQDQGVSEEELSERTGMSPEEIRSTLVGLSRRPVSIEAEVTLDLALPVDTEQSAAETALLEVMTGTVSALPMAQQAVLALHYYGGLELQEVARLLQITESRASHLHTDAVLAVHAALRQALGDVAEV